MGHVIQNDNVVGNFIRMLENPPRHAPGCVRDYPIHFLIELEEICDCDALYGRDAMVREG
jgi:hypothetical protein